MLCCFDGDHRHILIHGLIFVQMSPNGILQKAAKKKNRIENAMSNLDREETRHGIKLSNDAFSQVEIYVQTFLSTFNLFLLLSKMTKTVNVLQS